MLYLQDAVDGRLNEELDSFRGPVVAMLHHELGRSDEVDEHDVVEAGAQDPLGLELDDLVKRCLCLFLRVGRCKPPELAADLFEVHSGGGRQVGHRVVARQS